MAYALATPSLPETIRTREGIWIIDHCPACHGEGTTPASVPGGAFDPGEGQWYPQERDIVCGECSGTGMIDEFIIETEES